MMEGHAATEKGYGLQPRYASFEAVREAVTWLIGRGIVKTG
jgi:hypothetical protein